MTCMPSPLRTGLMVAATAFALSGCSVLSGSGPDLDTYDLSEIGRAHV